MLSYTALALTAAAAVSALPAPREQGLRIPISMSKRSGIRNDIAQGRFSPEKGDHYVNSLVGKYAQTLDNYRQNKGSEHPLAKGTLEERKLIKRQSEPLTDEEQGAFWQGNIQIGGQTVPVDFDTGSSDLWVPAAGCTSKGCQSAKQKYDPSKSKTSKKVSGTFSIQYGDGSTASGPEYTDTVTVGGLAATAQKLSAVTQDTIQQGTGILGMGWESISQLKSAPYFFSLVDQKKVSTGQFAFALKPQGAELYLGGSDKSQYTGAITWTDLTQESYWVTKGSMTSSGQSVLEDITMIIDTGTSLIVAPTAEVSKFYKAIGGTACPAATCGAAGYFEYPCNAKVEFKMGSTSFDVSSTFSLGSATSDYNGKCVGALVGSDGVPLNGMIVGDTFFQNVYSIFDATNKRVGFANIA